MSPPTAAAVLGEVLRRARESLGRSPEQVGALVGVAGRTIRRLEAGESDRPRRITLESLAGFYGLDPVALNGLASAPDEPEPLLHVLREHVSARVAPQVVEALDGSPDEYVELAMRWVRSRPAAAGPDVVEDSRHQFVVGLLRELRARAPQEYIELLEGMTELSRLDRSRRTLAVGLLRELRRAQAADRSPTNPDDA